LRFKVAESIQDFQCSVWLFPMNRSVTDQTGRRVRFLYAPKAASGVPFGETAVSWEGTQPDEINAEGVERVALPSIAQKG